MELRQLKTLVAIAERGTFAGAADAVGLTQSAVSLQIKHLEQELDTVLFDRTSRPPRLNARGLALVDQARQIVELCEQISIDTHRGTLKGNLSFGAVPTSMSTMLPGALAAMRDSYPELRIKVASGSSVELAARVRGAELDAALVSEPAQLVEDLQVHPIVSEPLYVIAPPDTDGESDKDILEALPFIQFNKRAWAGQQIHQHIVARRIRTDLAMEIDSLEAITQMVRNGLGASVVPLSKGAVDAAHDLKILRFGNPPMSRSMVVIERNAGPRAPFVSALVDVLRCGAAG